MLNNKNYHAKIILKRIFFRFGRFGLKKSVDVAYCGLESGTVSELRELRECANVFVVSIPNK